MALAELPVQAGPKKSSPFILGHLRLNKRDLGAKLQFNQHAEAPVELEEQRGFFCGRSQSRIGENDVLGPALFAMYQQSKPA